MIQLLLVGGADTARAPMAVVLLRRLAEAQNLAWSISSAGVLGHDDDPAEPEARDTMLHMGLDISTHRARSITDDLVADATLLIAIDSGTERVLQARFPEAVARITTLGALAGRPRDIPDPFRMQFGAWLTYARELEGLLEAALPRLCALLPNSAPAPVAEASLSEAAAQDVIPEARSTAVERIDKLLGLASDMPGVLDWNAARGQIESDLTAAALAVDATDLVVAYVGLLRAALSLTAAPPTAGQLHALREAIAPLRAPIGQVQLNQLSAHLGGWTQL